MRITASPGCVELSPISFDNFNMLIEKDGGVMSKTMERCSELVRRCLDCDYGKYCLEQKEANIKFLEENEK